MLLQLRNCRKQLSANLVRLRIEPLENRSLAFAVLKENDLAGHIVILSNLIRNDFCRLHVGKTKVIAENRI